jgi:glycosyltransferase involved in cell wall biosynthesis
VVCYVGRLDDRKGVLDLFDLVHPATRHQPVTLLIAGDGPRRAELEARARVSTPGLTVRVLGHVREVAEVMRASDVIMLPSSAEGLPQVLVQAASCGLPFVAYDVDGVAELLELGARGRVVALGDRDALATALDHELTSPSDRPDPDALEDPDRWAGWDPGYVARQYVCSYAWDLGGRPADDGAAFRP